MIEKLYHSNGTIKRSKIPMMKKRGGDTDERKFLFFLNSQFDFSNQVWKSGLFKIPDSDWDDVPEYKYPILGDGSHLDSRVPLSRVYFKTLTLILESWEKNPKRGAITEHVLRKKIQSATLRRFVYVSVLWIFFQKTRSATVPKMAYIFVQHGIFSLILAYAI